MTTRLGGGVTPSMVRMAARVFSPPLPSRAAVHPQWHTVPRGWPLYRVSRHAGFRHFGPLDFRFDHHTRGSTAKTPEDRGVFYGAPSLECCIAEVYDELGAVFLDDLLLLPEIRRPLTLLDVRGVAASAAGAPADISDYPLRPPTQEWSRYFYENLDLYREVDGLLYTARHSGMDAYALYERCEGAIHSPGVAPYAYPLSHERVREQVVDIAARRNLAVMSTR